MAKADPKVNYYAVLELTPTAGTEDIKKQFRKLARSYHPDRNPGKETEYVPKFQAIQAAHEILSDPQERAKYDADRRRLGLSSKTTGTNRYSAHSDFPPPPRRTARTQPPQPPPRANPTPPPTWWQHTAPPPPPQTPNSRRTGYARPTQPPPVPPRSGQDSAKAARDAAAREAEAAARAFHHFTHMPPGFGQPQREQWSDEEPRRPRASSRTERPEPFGSFGRSNTTRSSKKSGFDPSTPGIGDWEPQAPRSSAYTSYARQSTPKESPRSPKPQQPSPTSFPPPPPPPIHPTGNPFQTRPEDMPFTDNMPRMSQPYAAHPSEKSYFKPEPVRRSNTVRESSRQASSRGPTPTKTSPRGPTNRHRSVSPPRRASETPMSPRGRTPHAQPEAKKQSSDSRSNSMDPNFHQNELDSDDPDSDDSSLSGTNGSNGFSDPPRKKAEPGQFWRKTKAAGMRSMPETPLSGGGGAKPMGQERSYHMWAQQWPFGPERTNMKHKLPSWAFPSFVTTKKSKFDEQGKREEPVAQRGDELNGLVITECAHFVDFGFRTYISLVGGHVLTTASAALIFQDSCLLAALTLRAAARSISTRSSHRQSNCPSSVAQTPSSHPRLRPAVAPKRPLRAVPPAHQVLPARAMGARTQRVANRCHPWARGTRRRRRFRPSPPNSATRNSTKTSGTT
ncbi:hypothetical protein EJ06DRAFT_293123 [Trichodelitschia bisporula]|uniref:J domain-containing protein n=1 Tax=Trichodelitschia bisporula TaxID=703511 RepID=A0A6G1I6G2_9PEZI|nr:hypothetical protein EJ06DRAFT_293123 [Trichodelitschia bisporula]